ncbi:MAG: SH3 domain-containing protein [Prevotellaceae bacterium]|nr:SH3 domain-containing protein [Candidatus Faecinaster equi]
MATKKKPIVETPVTEEVVATPEPIKEEKTVTVKCPKLNFRNEPSTESKVIDVLLQGDQLKVVEDGETWTKVKAGRKVGYVMTQYIG